MGYTLLKPYTKDKKNEFVVQYNHNQGLSLQETEKALYALEKWEEIVNDEIISHKAEYDEQMFIEAKANKTKEASDKAKQAIEDGYVLYKEAEFETNTQTLNDLSNEREICLALGQTSTTWLSKDDKAIELILDAENPVENDDIFQIGLLVKQFKNGIWNVKYVGYLQQIEAAETIEEVEAIIIDYTTNNHEVEA